MRGKCNSCQSWITAGTFSQPARRRRERGEERRREERRETRDALLVNKSFERIFTHNLSSFRWPDLASHCFAGRSCRTAAQEICQCAALREMRAETGTCCKREPVCMQRAQKRLANPLWHTQLIAKVSSGCRTMGKGNCQCTMGNVQWASGLDPKRESCALCIAKTLDLPDLCNRMKWD